jgi:DNA replication protein DnaC
MKSPLLEEQCKALKLGSVSRVYTQIDFESREQFLTDLFAEELKIREDNRNRRRLKRAGFPQTKTLEEFSWDNIVLPPQTTREHLTELGYGFRSPVLWAERIEFELEVRRVSSPVGG